ncbi:MAG TPA: S46 family peptidase [Bacteroidales bacterium]|nr:S46 family peptidase [Bacteroidales bacterium]
MKKLLLSLPVFLVSLFATATPDEGMWIPILIEKYNIKLMQEKGFKLSAEDIYSVNKACMKDAVVIFGGGCTGELISPDGLLITNHHCGYGTIQRLSSIENDYLANGFWAMSREEEIPAPGLSVTILKWMEDVTDRMMKGITGGMDAQERQKILDANSEDIRRKALEGTGYTARISPFYMGNQYFMLVYETFSDVRFVGAPPSSIGKFGGETDNWVWPRHTGDFSLWRVYAGTENKPARYASTNVPYKPLYHFPISLKGVQEGDFTMVFGYPGSTSQYVPSFHIDMVKNHINPKMIAIRTKKIEIMEAAMNTDPLIRLQYSAKKSGVANAWKKWIGENQGLDRMRTIEKKQAYEKRLTDWINSDPARKTRYGHLLPEYEKLYSQLKDYSLVNSFTSDAFFSSGAEAVGFARNMMSFANLFESEADEARIEAVKGELIAAAARFFKNYNYETDKELFVAVMELYGGQLEEKWQAPGYLKIKNAWKGDFQALADKIYPVSVFTDEARFTAFVNGFGKRSLKALKKDPIYNLASSTSEFISENVRGELIRIQSEIQKLNPLYMTLQMEFDSNRLFYPDANSTLRVAYGEVKGYYSKDAVYFRHYSTLKGIIEKDNPEIFDYDVPDKLKELYRTKNYGRYTQNGEVPVCFIATNHTTGGNSGSPVINAEGHLIGVNFDRAWEGVASDMAFNPEQSRNISLDIRYALFIIDKFAGAGYLLDEMTLVE